MKNAILYICMTAMVAAGWLAPGCSRKADPERAGDQLTVYSGRSEDLIQPLLDRFTEQTGIRVLVRYGQSSEMAATLLEEGARSPADVFFAQDAGALGALDRAGLLAALPSDLIEEVDPRFRSPRHTWVGVSGRARVVVYNPDRVSPDDLPADVRGFCDPRWKGRVGWAPPNASFQSFVTSMRLSYGDAGTRDWLECMKANGARSYAKNTPILIAVAAGEIDVGLTNHYYLHTLQRERGRELSVRNHYLPSATLLNVAGVALLRSSTRTESALEFARFLLSQEAQRYFTEHTFEYPLARSVQAHPVLPPLHDLLLDEVDLGRLDDLEGTLRLFQDAGIL